MDKTCSKEKKYIGQKIRILSNLIRRKTFSSMQNDIVQALGSQGFIIKFLYENSNTDIFQKDIEKKFKVRRSTVTSSLKRMESAGLIRRESVESDNRLKKITLTEKGLSAHMYIEEKIVWTESALFSALTESEVEKFFKICEKLQNALEEGETLWLKDYQNR